MSKRGGLCCPFFIGGFNSRLNENSLVENRGIIMSKIFSVMCLVFFVTGLSACSSPPAKYGNTPEQQRKNAQDAQEELSTDVNRGTR